MLRSYNAHVASREAHGQTLQCLKGPIWSCTLMLLYRYSVLLSSLPSTYRMVNRANEAAEWTPASQKINPLRGIIHSKPEGQPLMGNHITASQRPTRGIHHHPTPYPPPRQAQTPKGAPHNEWRTIPSLPGSTPKGAPHNEERTIHLLVRLNPEGRAIRREGNQGIDGGHSPTPCHLAPHKMMRTKT